MEDSVFIANCMKCKAKNPVFCAAPYPNSGFIGSVEPMDERFARLIYPLQQGWNSLQK